MTAHGRDVRNVGTIPGVAYLTRTVVQRASTVIAVSEYLRRELEDRLPAARGKTEVVDSGVDLERFRSVDPAERLESPAFMHVGSLTERKNVVRLADAFARLGRGSLTFVGDGPQRPRLENRAGVRVVGRVPHADVPAWLTAADVVCGPALIEPFGQSLLEAACARDRRATRVGRPPEFVTPESGVLVDRSTLPSLRALDVASRFPVPNMAARAAAAEHDVRRQAERVEAILERAAEIGQPDLDQRPNASRAPPPVRWTGPPRSSGGSSRPTRPAWPVVPG